MNKKWTAFTLMEVTIAMLLSAICLAICYMALNMIEHYFENYKQKNETMQELLLLQQNMHREMQQSQLVTRVGDALKFQLDSMSVTYEFLDSVIVRKQGLAKPDSFSIQVVDPIYKFKSDSVTKDTVVDAFAAVLQTKKTFPIKLSLAKWYSAANLISSDGSPKN